MGATTWLSLSDLPSLLHSSDALPLLSQRIHHPRTLRVSLRFVRNHIHQAQPAMTTGLC